MRFIKDYKVIFCGADWPILPVFEDEKEFNDYCYQHYPTKSKKWTPVERERHSCVPMFNPDEYGREINVISLNPKIDKYTFISAKNVLIINGRPIAYTQLWRGSVLNKIKVWFNLVLFI